MENVTLHNQEGKETIFVNDLRTIVSAARDASYRMANLMERDVFLDASSFNPYLDRPIDVRRVL